MKKILLFVLLALLLASCGDDNDKGPNTGYDYPGKGVFICSEGQYSAGSASLSFYDFASDEVKNNIYHGANNAYLGDGLQSMTIINGVGYLCVTETGSVVAIDTRTFAHKSMLEELVKPRYVTSVGNDLYISSLGGQYMTVASRSSLKTTGTVDFGKTDDKPNTTEQIIVHNGYLYVNFWSYGDKLFKVDPATKQIVGTLEVTIMPNSMVLDKNNKIWILSGGAWDGSVAGTLTMVNPSTMIIEKTLTFSNSSVSPVSPSKLAINKAGDRLYYIESSWENGVSQSKVCVVNIDALALPLTALIEGNGKSFYGLGIDPGNSDIYVSDALDFQQNGIVYRYNSQGTEITHFEVGISPGSFCFK